MISHGTGRTHGIGSQRGINCKSGRSMRPGSGHTETYLKKDSGTDAGQELPMKGSLKMKNHKKRSAKFLKKTKNN
jgi:hypothetical protein